MADGKTPSGAQSGKDTAGERSRRWRRGSPHALAVIVCVAAVTAALTSAAKPLSNTPFALTGHWVYNSVLRTVFHVDGGTTDIDAQLPVAAAPGSQVVQGDTNGYVVGPTSITGFNKATLQTQQAIPAPVDEVPLGIEAVGGPYLVYRNAGRIVRLGDPVATISVGGAVGDPLVTPDGTMWLHRTDVGLICTLPKDADRISGCPVPTPRGHPGGLTTIGGHLAFVDMFTGQVHTVGATRLGPGVPLGVPVSPDSRLAAGDLAGRVVLLDPERHSLLLAGTGKPVTIALPGGDYDGPVSTGSSVVVVDRQDGTVLTFGPNGNRVDTTPIGHDGGTPRISHGEDNRVYVENPSGTKVLVVAPDGTVRSVPVAGKPATPTPNPAARTTPAGKPGSQPATAPGQPAAQPGQRGPVGQTVKPTPKQTVALPPSAPGAPTAVSASAGAGAATVTWGAAADNRSPITSYRMSWRGDSGQAGSLTVGGGTRAATVGGLTDGVRYVFTVAAVNGVGSGPGVSAAPVVPVAAATAPSPTASYQNPSATVSWTTPDLRGGTLVDYLVSATGEADRTVTANSTGYTGLTGGQTMTFTVRAVTRTPDGRTLTGAAGSTSLTVPAAPAITISHGTPTTTSNCHAPSCAWVDATMTGFAPDTPYSITLSSSSDPNVQTESFTTNASGNAEYDQLDYDVPGETVWISVPTSGGTVTSNKIVWGP